MSLDSDYQETLANLGTCPKLLRQVQDERGWSFKRLNLCYVRSLNNITIPENFGLTA